MKLGIVVGTTAIVSLLVGSAAGFFVAKRQLTSKFEADLAEQIEATKNFYKVLHKKEQYSTPEKAAAVLLPEETKEVLRLYKGVPAPEDTTKVGHTNYAKMSEPKELVAEEPPPLFNVFADPEEPVDIEMEIRNRTEEAPFIISVEEFLQNEENLAQSTITYYGGDGVLADERDSPIRDIDMTVGDNNIMRFGHRSGNKHLLYVRNHILGTDFEIQYSSGKFVKEVLDLS